MRLSEVLFNAMSKTKTYMLRYYRAHDLESIEQAYHDFRVFTRFLFIRGGLQPEHEDLRIYVNHEMLFFKNMLLENERWAK